jgi:hypothetical protein
MVCHERQDADSDDIQDVWYVTRGRTQVVTIYGMYGQINAPALSTFPPSMVGICHERQEVGSDDIQDIWYVAIGRRPVAINP